MAAPIVHIEFSSSDFARTAAFYGELFGWQTQQNATASYMKFDGVDGPSGGWVRADLVQSPGPVPYLLVDDLAATLDKIEKSGGRILARRLPFAGGGEVGLFADPDGNVLGAWMRKKGDTKGEAAKGEAKGEPTKGEPDPEAQTATRVGAPRAPKAAAKKEPAGAKPLKTAAAPKPKPARRK